MLRNLCAITIVLLVSCNANGAEKASAVLEQAVKALGASNIKTIGYSGSGAMYNVGQNVRPDVPWPKFDLKSYTRVINYESASSREELVRTPAAGGPEQRPVWLVAGRSAWNMAGNNATAAPAQLDERLAQIWVTPHGFIKAALASDPIVQQAKTQGRQLTTVKLTAHGKYKVNGVINEQGLVETVETWIPNPVMGDMLVETTYADYKDFGGVQFPTRIVQKQGGFPFLELSVSEVQSNVPAEIESPESVRQAMSAPPAVKVETQKLAEGVWYLTGGTHHSLAVEFKDHLVVIEGPLNEERSIAVIEEVKRLVPGKRIRYLVNTHHHFDHSGGIRTYAAEGAIILTHQINKAFYEQAFRTPRMVAPDRLSRSAKRARIEGVGDKHVLTDGARTLELHRIQGSGHHEGILLAYLPAEKILIEADVYTPAAANAPPPTTPNPFSVNLYENIERLKLPVEQIAPLHGRLVTLADLKKAIGRT